MTVINAQRSPYLEGVYAPVADEVDVAELPVTGAIPTELTGCFVRNGPNPMFEPLGPYHPFDGDGMLHGLWLDDGRARYRNRWIRSKGLAAEERAGRALYGGMESPVFPDPSLVGDARGLKNSANTHVVRHAGRIYTLLEVAKPTLVADSLDTIGEFDFRGRLVGPMTAHPKIDPLTGEMHFFGYDFAPPYLRYHVVDATGTLVRSVDITLPDPVMIHDFVLTNEHVVFLDAPAVFDLHGFFRGGPMLSWRPERATRLGVMPRAGDTTDIVWCDLDPCFVFHFLNGWTDGNRITIDAARLDRMNIGIASDVEDLGTVGRLARFTVDLAARTAGSEPLDDRGADFCRINDRVAGSRHRFGYLASFSSDRAKVGEFDAIVKYDVRAGTSQAREWGERFVVGEPVFAADPTGSGEDDGWLLTYVYDRTQDTSDAVILDAHSLEQVAAIHLPQRVPFGFHGNWFAAD